MQTIWKRPRGSSVKWYTINDLCVFRKIHELKRVIVATPAYENQLFRAKNRIYATMKTIIDQLLTVRNALHSGVKTQARNLGPSLQTTQTRIFTFVIISSTFSCQTYT